MWVVSFQSCGTSNARAQRSVSAWTPSDSCFVILQEQPASANEQLTAQTSQPALSPPRRPTTRSQTGRVPKRRPRDDSPMEIKRIPAPRKKQKTIQKPPPESESDKEEVRSTPSSSRRGASDDSDEHAKGVDTPDSVRVMSENAPSPRSARPRAILPTPVPFLTKKSRGRRVPTQASSGTDTEQNARVYICKVEGCGKCFHRGEHLKRHIRSIHTHEKRKSRSFIRPLIFS